MSITEQDVTYVADLANLELTAEERSRLAKDLSSILEYISLLNELNTDDVPPMAQVSASFDSAGQSAAERSAAVQREDTPVPCLPHEAALQNAPVSNGDFFKVPKVIER
ncbi:MAG TPA: Asp-tRNA(Asn)/Glu-tRNA(Gln) amidotransferase subunit GatC [Candidatus Angelobacter sp.]